MADQEYTRQRCEALTDKHHEWHRDFAKLLTTISAVFLTLEASFSGAFSRDMPFLLQCSVGGNLLVMVLGVSFLFLMLKMPLYERRTIRDQSDQNRQKEEDLRIACERIHGLQMGIFLLSFALLAGALIFGAPLTQDHATLQQ